jgi:AraC-like DNA-binding protein
MTLLTQPVLRPVDCTEVLMTTAKSHLGSATHSYAQAVLDYFEQRGEDPVNVFGDGLVKHIRLGAAAERLSISQWQDMLQDAARHLSDPAFPLRLAATIKPRHLGMLGFLLMSCDTLGAAAITLQRYEQLLDSVNAADFNVEECRCTLTWRALIDNPPADFIMLSMALWVQQARWLAERPDLVCDVSFTFDEPESADVRACFDATFGGLVQFNKGINQMSMPLSNLSLPVAQRDKHVHESLKQQAEVDLLALLGQDHGFLPHLESVLAEQLPLGDVTLVHVARALRVAPRTLQTRLEQHGVTYREVLERVRCKLAERHLRNPVMTLADVAASLGFADQSSFQHAFKRWTGVAPGDYRRRLI